MPKKPAATTPEVTPADALTIVLGKNHRVYYYLGPNTLARPAAWHPTALGEPLRKVLADWQQLHKSQVFIKPSPDSGYPDMVKMLDEMSRSKQPKYALLDLSPADRELLAAAER